MHDRVDRASRRVLNLWETKGVGEFSSREAGTPWGCQILKLWGTAATESSELAVTLWIFPKLYQNKFTSLSSQDLLEEYFL